MERRSPRGLGEAISDERSRLVQPDADSLELPKNYKPVCYYCGAKVNTHAYREGRFVEVVDRGKRQLFGVCYSCRNRKKETGRSG